MTRSFLRVVGVQKEVNSVKAPSKLVKIFCNDRGITNILERKLIGFPYVRNSYVYFTYSWRFSLVLLIEEKKEKKKDTEIVFLVLLKEIYINWGTTSVGHLWSYFSIENRLGLTSFYSKYFVYLLIGELKTRTGKFYALLLFSFSSYSFENLSHW